MLDNKVGASHSSIEERISTKLSYIYMQMGQPPWELSWKKPNPNLILFIVIMRSLQNNGEWYKLI
jgi:hypothetical protein